MSKKNKPNQHRRWLLRKVALRLLDAMKLLDETCKEPHEKRVKLSHIWLAQELGMNTHIAWGTLEILANWHYRCVHVQGRNTPIRWLDDPSLNKEREEYQQSLVSKKQKPGE